MGPILIASGNPHKHEEIARILRGCGVSIELVRPADLALRSPPPRPAEDGASYLENAAIKARAFSRWSGLAALADDSGLEVAALGGAPGLRSARYAGEEGNAPRNIEKLLAELSDEEKDLRSHRGKALRALAARLAGVSPLSGVPVAPRTAGGPSRR